MINLFIKQQTKKQIALNIQNANVLLKEINRNIAPANNLYWEHELVSYDVEQDECNFLSLKRNAPATIIYAKQLTELYFATYKISIDYPKSTEFVEFVFKKHFKTVVDHLEMLLDNMKKLPDYHESSYLRDCYKVLLSLHKNIKAEENIILSSQKDQINNV